MLIFLLVVGVIGSVDLISTNSFIRGGFAPWIAKLIATVDRPGAELFGETLSGLSGTWQSGLGGVQGIEGVR